ncbi:transmembrane prediction [Botrimarina sp.]|uniref:transmembrane prediction n=1 Tax=Botrimarina sp. TaxID=2795802 RepID=UPI0032EBE5B8
MPSETPDSPAPPPSEARSLWGVTLAPVVWSVHFLACYITAAVYCEKFATRQASLGPVRVAVAAYTAAAVLAIAVVGWRAARRLRGAHGERPYDEATPVDQARFLAFATLLLSLLSLVATFYVAAVAAFVTTCQ